MSELTAHISLFHFLKIALAKLPDLGYVWHTRNENASEDERKRGGQLGVIPGVWDVLFIGPNKATISEMRAGYFRGVAIELKSTAAYRKADNGLSPEQRAWMTRYSANDWYVAIYPEQDWTAAARLLVRWVGGNVEDFDFGGRR